MKSPKLIFLLVIALMVSACNTGSREQKEGFKFDEGSTQSDIEVTKSFIYLFPAPGEILDRFYDADLAYIEDLLHDPAAGDGYLTERDKGLNMGIYLTDMAYTALFTRSSEAIDFLDVIQELSTELNVSSTAFESLLDRAKGNIGVSDSLITISNEVFFNMVDFLENSGKENTIAIISCGAYIESMYLALNSIDEFNEYDPIIRQISDLKHPMDNLMSHAESVSEDPNVQSILEYIKKLNAIFAELEGETTKAKKTEPGVITLSGGSTPELTRENFDQMKQLVIDIRTLIVEQK